MTEKRISKAKLWEDVLLKPQRKNAAIAEPKAEMNATAVADSGKRLLSDRKPKKELDMMPGALKRVISSVEEVTDKEAMELA